MKKAVKKSDKLEWVTNGRFTKISDVNSTNKIENLTPVKRMPTEPKQPWQHSGLKRKILIASGAKGVRKADETLSLLEKYSKDKKQKVLIFDIDNEFGDYQTLDGRKIKLSMIGHDDIAGFMKQKTVEMRRIVPINSSGKQMSSIEIEELIVKILGFKNGCIFWGVKDLFSIIDNNTHKLTGLFANNNTRDLDIVTHVQSVNNVHPKLMQNVDAIRMYRQMEDVQLASAKLGVYFQLFKLAQLIVDREYENGNTRFFLYIDKECRKIRGVNREAFEIAALTYLLLYPKELNKKIKELKQTTEIQYTRIGVINVLKEQMIKNYL